MEITWDLQTISVLVSIVSGLATIAAAAYKMGQPRFFKAVFILAILGGLGFWIWKSPDLRDRIVSITKNVLVQLDDASRPKDSSEPTPRRIRRSASTKSPTTLAQSESPSPAQGSAEGPLAPQAAPSSSSYSGGEGARKN